MWERTRAAYEIGRMDLSRQKSNYETFTETGSFKATITCSFTLGNESLKLEC